jgi:hypothetical protein
VSGVVHPIVVGPWRLMHLVIGVIELEVHQFSIRTTYVTALPPNPKKWRV